MKKKNHEWTTEQIRLRGGVPCLSSTTFFKMGRVHVAVTQVEQWSGSKTMVMVIDKPKDTTVMSCWGINNAADRKKTERIFDALVTHPETDIRDVIDPI